MGRRAALVVALAVALALQACGFVGDDGEDPGSQASTPTLPAAAAVLRVASTAWPSCLNPVTCTDPAARDLVWEHVLPRLMEIGPDGQPRPSPVLAAAPEVRVDEAAGTQTITYVIADDARWHDGRPITSSDVTGTWLAHRDTPGARTAGYELIRSVDDSDPMVARVELSAPYADWPELFGGHTGWLLQADAFGGTTDLTGRFQEELGFGAGPFELASVDDRSIVLVAREEHWDEGRRAAVDQVRVERLPEGTGDLAGAIAGGIDVVWAPGSTGAPERFTRLRRPTPEVTSVVFDRRSAPLGSPAVREAVDIALDRRALLEELGGDPEELVTCLARLPQEPGCRDDVPPSDASPAAAELLLEADGWPRDPSGPRGRPGLPLLVPVTYDPSIPGADRVAGAIEAALVPLGFGVVRQPLDRGAWLQRDRGGPAGISVQSLPLATVGDVASLVECGEDGINPLGWCEAPAQALAGQLRSTVDVAARARLLDDLADLIAGVRSWLPLRQRADVLLVDGGRVEVPDEVPIGSGPLGGLHRYGRVDR